MSYVFRLETEPVIEFWQERDALDLLTAPLTLRALRAIGSIMRPLNIAGDVFAPTASVTLSNGNGALNDYFNSPPLGVIARIIGPDGELFAGTVTRITAGAQIQISIEGGLGLPLTATVPLRNTGEWGEYQDTRPIPYGYGRQTTEPLQYNQERTLFVVAAGNIAGVDEVRRDDVAAAFDSYPGLDTAGKPVQFIALASPLADGERIECDWRGRLHPTTGELLTNPAEILWDFLANICGLSVTLADLDAFRGDTLSRGLEIKPYFDDDQQTIQRAIARICQNSGAAWSIGMPGIARRYPAVRDDQPVAYEFGQLTASNPSASVAFSEIATVLQVDFDFDHAKSRYKSSLELQAPRAIERYGERRELLELPAVGDSRTALSIGQDWLQHRARSWWQVSLQSSRPPALAINPGDWITYTNPTSPVSGVELLVTGAQLSPGSQRIDISAEGATDPAPAVELVRISEALGPVVLEQATVVAQADIAEFTIRGTDGNPLVEARCTLDDSETRLTDQNGYVQFTGVSPGEHTLVVEADGQQPMQFSWIQGG